MSTINFTNLVNDAIVDGIVPTNFQSKYKLQTKIYIPASLLVPTHKELMLVKPPIVDGIVPKHTTN